MNFLAHLYLSGKSHNVMIGNFIGDFVKGKQVYSFAPEIIKGIILHREIDYFTDNHKVVAISKDRLRPKFRHYAGVITDIYFDHFLAKNWQFYHNDTLENFVNYAYNVLVENKGILPQKASEMLPFMVSGNWLYNYSRIEGIRRAFEGMSRRTKYQSNMNKATTELLENYNLYEEDFFSFFPDLIQFAQNNLSADEKISY
jgi:acyl carrier protein phosphodiesterase